MRSSPVRGLLQPSIRSTGQDFLTFFCVVALIGAIKFYYYGFLVSHDV
jgi:hypothetical protein